MPKLTSDELEQILKRPGVRERNPGVSNYPPCRRSIAKLEPAFVDVSLGKAQLQNKSRQCFRIRVLSVRERLIDEDNLSCKYLVDQCRYHGLVPDDKPQLTTIQVTQRKCEEGETEHVEITIEKL